jgi:hypothetical protein
MAHDRRSRLWSSNLKCGKDMSTTTSLELATSCSVMALGSIEIYLMAQFDQHHGSRLGDAKLILLLPLLAITVNLCRELSERIFKGIIWSQSSQTFEVPAGESVGFVECGGVADRFEVNDRAPARAVTFLMAVGCVILIALNIVSPPTERDWNVRLGLLLVMTSGLGVAALMQWFGPPLMHVSGDSEGIFGKEVGFPRNKKRVLWSQIKAYEILTYYNRSGRPVLIQPVFKDILGKELLSLDLMAIKMADQERLVKYIKTRLPKSPTEPWDL